jgi:hypothetical protein
MKGGWIVVERLETVASKQGRYLKLMQKAQQLDDQILVKLIGQKLTSDDRNSYPSATGDRVIIQFPSMQASREPLDQDLRLIKAPQFNLINGGNKLLTFYSLAAFIIVCTFVLLVRFHDPDVFSLSQRITVFPPSNLVTSAEYGPQCAPQLDVFAGACALLLVGHMFWAFYRKCRKDNQITHNTMESSFHDIALETGWTEFELFRLSAESWTVSAAKIDEDFKRYMAHQILPYYVIDFMRKNHENNDKSLIKGEEILPTSLRDLMIALLLFPGSILLPLLIPVFFNYSKPW